VCLIGIIVVAANYGVNVLLNLYTVQLNYATYPRSATWQNRKSKCHSQQSYLLKYIWVNNGMVIKSPPANRDNYYHLGIGLTSRPGPAVTDTSDLRILSICRGPSLQFGNENLYLYGCYFPTTVTVVCNRTHRWYVYFAFPSKHKKQFYTNFLSHNLVQ